MLTVNTGEIGECPDCPVLALRRVVDPDKSENGFEAPVVDVPLGVEIPTLNGGNHLAKNVITGGITDRPGFRAIAGHVG